MLEELTKIPFIWVDIKQPKGFTHQRHVCAPSKLHPLSRLLHPKNFSEGAFKGLDAGAAAADQCAIDIKKYEFNHATEKLLINMAATSVFLGRRSGRRKRR